RPVRPHRRPARRPRRRHLRPIRGGRGDHPRRRCPAHRARDGGGMTQTATPATEGTTRRRFVIPAKVFAVQSYLALILVVLAAVIFSPRRGGDVVFLAPENLLNIIRATSEIGIIAIGMT